MRTARRPAPTPRPQPARNALRAAPARHDPLPAPTHGPVVYGFLFAVGALAAYWLGGLLIDVAHVLTLVVVAMFLAAGLHPLVEFFVRHRIPHQAAVTLIIVLVLGAVTLFFFALIPVISEQVAALVANVPDWLQRLQDNERVQQLDARYQVVDKVQHFVVSGDWSANLFGGVLGFGVAVLSLLGNVSIVTVLTLYFLASMDTTKAALYRLAPASRRARISTLTDRILDNIGGFVGGAFIVATCAGLTSLAFLFAVGLGKYAIALAAVVAVLDIIPMIGATIGAVLVTSIGFATDPKIGIACAIFYLIYQQIENYGIYPRVMQRSVNVPGSVTVIAALIGAALLGVVGAMLAVPVAAAVLLLIREVWLPRQATR